MTVVFILVIMLSPDALTTTENERILGICLAGHNELVQHGHAEIHVYIDGREVDVPAEIGINGKGCSSGMRAVHTHDDTGLLHIETPFEASPTLGNFFSIWEQPFDSTHLMDEVVDDGHEIVMRLYASQAAYDAGDFVISEEYGVHELVEGEVVVLEYKAKS